jgi:hypothetical protein
MSSFHPKLIHESLIALGGFLEIFRETQTSADPLLRLCEREAVMQPRLITVAPEERKTETHDCLRGGLPSAHLIV